VTVTFAKRDSGTTLLLYSPAKMRQKELLCYTNNKRRRRPVDKGGSKLSTEGETPMATSWQPKGIKEFKAVIGVSPLAYANRQTI